MSRVPEWILGYEPFKIRLPDLKCRTLSVVTAVLLGATGLLLTFFLGDPRWFARFGSLIVLVAVSYACFGQLNSSHILDWAETARKTLIDTISEPNRANHRGSPTSLPPTSSLPRPSSKVTGRSVTTPHAAQLRSTQSSPRSSSSNQRSLTVTRRTKCPAFLRGS